MIKHAYLLISFFFYIFVGCNSCYQKNEGIILSITPVKSNKQKDSILVKLSFINNSNKKINIYCWQKKTIYPSINYFLKFKIYPIKQKDKAFIYSYDGPSILLPYKDDYITIKPRGIYTEVINLTKFYNPYKDLFYKKYEISCCYQYKHKKEYRYGDNLWEGKLISNKIIIEYEHK